MTRHNPHPELMMPDRVQLSRAKGWRMPANTVKVDRSTRWGNPWTAKNSGDVHPALRFTCETLPLWDVSELRGKNLACWCPLNEWCHADALLEAANSSQSNVSDDARAASGSKSG